MKLHFHNPVTIELEGWPDTSTQQALAEAPAWHQRLQSLRCTLGFHYWGRSRGGQWTWAYGREYQFRMCQRWAPRCWTTDHRPRGKHNYIVTFPLYPFVMLRFRFLDWRRHRA